MAANKYRRWYTQLMRRATNRQLAGYYERHHILPRAMGGTNDHANLVQLTYREHFLAHWLLTKFTTGAARIRMCNAMFRMTNQTKRHKRITTSWQYTIAKNIHTRNMQRPEVRRKIGLRMSKFLQGNTHLLGHKHSAKSRAKMSAKLKGNKHALGHKHSAAWRKANRIRLKGNKHALGNRHTLSAEWRAACSARLKGNKYCVGRKLTFEHRAKIGAARRAAWKKRKQEIHA